MVSEENGGEVVDKNQRDEVKSSIVGTTKFIIKHVIIIYFISF